MKPFQCNCRFPLIYTWYIFIWKSNNQWIKSLKKGRISTNFEATAEKRLLPIFPLTKSVFNLVQLCFFKQNHTELNREGRYPLARLEEIFFQCLRPLAIHFAAPPQKKLIILKEFFTSRRLYRACSDIFSFPSRPQKSDCWRSRLCIPPTPRHSVIEADTRPYIKEEVAVDYYFLALGGFQQRNCGTRQASGR